MKKVTMFVWNNFTNDARVTREAKTLQSHYDVTVIAKRENNERHIPLKQSYKEGYNAVRKHKTELPNFIADRIYNNKLKTILLKHMPNAFLMMKMIQEGFRQDADIYHSHDLNTLIQGIACAKLRTDKRILIFDAHEVNTSRTNYNLGLVGAIEKFLIRFTDRTIVENETRATYHELLYGYRPMSLYNYSEYYDIDEVEAINLPLKYDKTFIYQGGLQEGRGLERLLRAFKEADIPANLLMVGDGKIRPQLEALTRSFNLQDKVTFTGRVPYESLRSYTKAAYAGFQILENVNFNHYSASSNKLYEYMMAHIPVIATDLPEIKTVVEEEGIGLIIKHDSEGELTAAIRKMFEDEAMRNAMKERMKISKEQYNWDKEKQKLLNLYQDLEVD
ncbi:glycosyltransferase [Macrococcoides caseolyticum]|uniref:glycosyltransferase n=1 Tax=Macrococcoides caseolyticum TaxID=69966 RepID=UPI0011A0150A|nr:glycosyltransferase [Macrococcus caseolyticus]